MAVKFDLTNIQFDFKDKKGYDQSYLTRYMLICELVRQASAHIKSTRQLHILDLGGYNGLARELLPEHRVTILDTHDDNKLKDYIQVSSAGIPADDDAFDIVISTDVLEHVVSSDRDVFIADAVRVAKHFTFIAAPFGDEEVEDEEFLSNQMYVGQTNEEYSWLKEHHEYGLPKRKWMEKTLGKQQVEYTVFSHTTTRLWGQLTAISFFTADNIYQVNRSLGMKLKRLNDEYFQRYAHIDFPKVGYRTFYIISKRSTPSVVTPEYNRDEIKLFMGKVQRTFGRVTAKMSELHGEYNTLLQKNSLLQEKEAALNRRIEQLESLERAYYEVLRSKRYRLAERVVKIAHISKKKK